jgi:hypothetical protein
MRILPLTLPSGTMTGSMGRQPLENEAMSIHFPALHGLPYPKNKPLITSGLKVSTELTL